MAKLVGSAVRTGRFNVPRNNGPRGGPYLAGRTAPPPRRGESSAPPDFRVCSIVECVEVTLGLRVEPGITLIRPSSCLRTWVPSRVYNPSRDREGAVLARMMAASLRARLRRERFQSRFQRMGLERSPRRRSGASHFGWHGQASACPSRRPARANKFAHATLDGSRSSFGDARAPVAEFIPPLRAARNHR